MKNHNQLLAPQPTVQQLTRRIWVTTEAWGYRDPSGFDFFLAPGFLSDGYSVPRWLWWCLRPADMLGPAFLHDALCESRGRAHHMLKVFYGGEERDLTAEPFSRRQVNQFFFCCMLDSTRDFETSALAHVAVELYLCRRWNTAPEWTQTVIQEFLNERES